MTIKKLIFTYGIWENNIPFLLSATQWMVEESQRQAREKHIAGDYSLGKLDEYGQRIHIQMTIPDRVSGEVKIFRTAWMTKPNGELVLVTPYGDDK